MSLRAGESNRVDFLYSSSAEKAVLGCMIAQPTEVIDDVTASLAREDFFVPAHREIFVVLIDLYENGSGIDTMLIDAYLRNQKSGTTNMADVVGSPGILAEFLVEFATHLNVGSYIRIVKEKSQLRKLHAACGKILEDITENPDQVAEVLDRAESTIFDQTAITIGSERPFCEVIASTASKAIEWSEMGGGLCGHSTGFSGLDRHLGGWSPDQLIVIGGASGAGKSALILTMARHLLRQKIAVGMWSGEMSERQLSNRILAGEGIVPARSIFQGTLSEEQRLTLRRVSEQCRDWPFYIDCIQGLDIQQIRSRARRWKRKHDIQAMILDHAQLARSLKARDKRAEVSDISRNSKEMAKELGIPVFLLSQLNCDADTVPTKANLKESATLIEDADVILLMHEISSDHEGHIRKHNLKLAKVREGISGQSIVLDYLAWRTHFRESTDAS